MPGIAGYYGQIEKPQGDALLVRMLAALKINDRQLTEAWADNAIGLGSVSLNRERRAGQPIWNTTSTLALVFDGELYADEAERQEQRTRFPSAGSDAAYVLSLYETLGDKFVEQLNGSFAGAIWEPANKTLLLFNDRIGSRPLYYSHSGERFVFASALRAIVADPLLPRRLDRVAVAQLLAFEYMLQDRTYLEHAHLLPPATVLRVGQGRFDKVRYWRGAFGPTTPYYSRLEALDILYSALQKAVERQRAPQSSSGINLSGGLDSRMVLALLCRDRACTDLQTFTFGIPDCDDEHVAKQLAHVCGAQHQFFELKPDFLLETAETGVRITDGMKGCTHLQSAAFVAHQSQLVSTLYTGYLLDSLSTPDVAREHIGNFPEEDALALLHLQTRRLFPTVDPREVFTDEFWQAAEPGYTDSFREAALEVKDLNYATWHNSFELNQRQRRFTQLGNVLLREYLVCSTPFTDRDLIDASLQTSLGMRIDRYWVKQVMSAHAARYAKVPWELTGLPLVEGMRALAIRLDRQSRWFLRRKGINWIGENARRPYQDYALWMRTALRPWIEDLLLSPRALGRGILLPAFQRRVVEEHMAGADNSRELGMLLSMELWLRMYVD